MTPAELKAEIETGPLAAELAPFVTSGNDAAIANTLNEPRGSVMLRERLVSARGVLADYPGGAAAGAAVLDKLEAAAASVPAVKWVMSFLRSDGIDIGSPATQAMLDQLAQGGLITQDEANNLKSLGFGPASRAMTLGATISHIDVAKALRG